MVKETGLAAFMTHIKGWGRSQTNALPPEERKELGYNPNPNKNMKVLSTLQKDSITAITTLCGNRSQLNQYLHRMLQIPEPVCECQTGIKNTRTFTIHLSLTHTNQRAALLEELKKKQPPANTSIQRDPIAFEVVEAYCKST